MCISEVPASNYYRRLPDLCERFIRRETTPKSSSIEAQGEVGFLHFRYVYYTIITILNNIPFMIQCWCLTSCRTDVCRKTGFEQPVVQRCRLISTLYVFSIDARYPNILYVALRRSTRGPRVFLIINYFHSTPTSLGSVQTYNSFHAFTLLTVLLFRPRPSIILFTFLRLLF
jgi:hypothetical protein